MSYVTDLLLKQEGYRQFPYRCTADKLTVGIGFNLDDVGLSKEESLVILEMRLEKLKTALRQYAWFDRLNEYRQAAVISMAYQLGIHGFGTFKNTIMALDAGDYEEAARRMLQSKWAKQTPNRSQEIAHLIETGGPL